MSRSAAPLFSRRRVLQLARPLGRRLQRRLDGWLSRLTAQQPASALRRAAVAALFRARLALLYNLDGRTGVIQRWVGAETETGRPLRVAFLGDSQSVKVLSPHYLQHILFRPGSLTVEDAGEIAMSRVAARAREQAAGADLVIAEVNDLLRFQPGGQGARLWMPTWVRMMIRFAPGQDCAGLEDTAMRAQRSNIRLARRSGFTFSISRSREDFDHFYEHMHAPMMRGRHAGYGVINRKEELLPLFEQGCLMLIHKDDRAVAGALLHIHARSVFAIANGILNGSEYWYEQGAISALYYFSIRWCCENGYARFDAGGVRPFAGDGLYAFKSRWGLRPEPDLWLGRSWLFWAPENAPAALDWLRAHPTVQV